MATFAWLCRVSVWDRAWPRKDSVRRLARRLRSDPTTSCWWEPTCSWWISRELSSPCSRRWTSGWEAGGRLWSSDISRWSRPVEDCQLPWIIMNLSARNGQSPKLEAFHCLIVFSWCFLIGWLFKPCSFLFKPSQDSETIASKIHDKNEKMQSNINMWENLTIRIDTLTLQMKYAPISLILVIKVLTFCFWTKLG